MAWPVRFGSPLHRAWSAAADLVVINLLTLLACLPVLTAGAALVACTRVCQDMVRDEDLSTVRCWWRVLRSELPGSLAWWLPVVALLTLAGWMGWVLAVGTGDAVPPGAPHGGETPSLTSVSAASGLVAAAVVLLVAVTVWLVSLVAQFDAPLGRQVMNAVRLAVGYLGRTALCLLVVLAVPAAWLLLPGSRLALGWFTVLLGVAFPLYFVALAQRGVIDRLRATAG